MTTNQIVSELEEAPQEGKALELDQITSELKELIDSEFKETSKETMQRKLLKKTV